MTKPADYTITLRALPDASDPNGCRRLRRLLKYAGRVCKLRAVAVVPAMKDVEARADE